MSAWPYAAAVAGAAGAGAAGGWWPAASVTSKRGPTVKSTTDPLAFHNRSTTVPRPFHNRSTTVPATVTWPCPAALHRRVGDAGWPLGSLPQLPRKRYLLHSLDGSFVEARRRLLVGPYPD